MKICAIKVKAHPQRKNEVVKIEDDGTLVVSVGAARVEGRANEALVMILAEYFAVSQSSIKILKGHLSSRKLVQVG